MFQHLHVLHTFEIPTLALIQIHPNSKLYRCTELYPVFRKTSAIFSGVFFLHQSCCWNFTYIYLNMSLLEIFIKGCRNCGQFQMPEVNELFNSQASIFEIFQTKFEMFEKFRQIWSNLADLKREPRFGIVFLPPPDSPEGLQQDGRRASERRQVPSRPSAS